MFRATAREEATPRAKANLLRGVLSGQLSVDDLTGDRAKSISDLCFQCHQCRLECPASVDIPKIVSELRAQYVATNGLPLSDALIARIDNLPKTSQNFDAMICWMSENQMLPRKKYILKHGSNEVTAMITKKVYTLNVNTFSKAADQSLKIGLNDIARISVKTSKPINFDSFESNRANGNFILIDQQTNETLAAGMIK